MPHKIRLVGLVAIIICQLFSYRDIPGGIHSHPPLVPHVYWGIKFQVSLGCVGMVDQSSKGSCVPGGIQTDPLALMKLNFKDITAFIVVLVYSLMARTILPGIRYTVLILANIFVFVDRFSSKHSQSLSLNLHGPQLQRFI